MARLHLHLTVDDLEQGVRYYSALFAAAPTRRESDYAKWELSDPPVHLAISARGAAPGLDHLGLQAESGDELEALRTRLSEAGIIGLEQPDTNCCYARSAKVWTTDPAGIAWEGFHTTASIATFGVAAEVETAPRSCCAPAAGPGSGCC